MQVFRLFGLGFEDGHVPTFWLILQSHYEYQDKVGLRHMVPYSCIRNMEEVFSFRCPGDGVRIRTQQHSHRSGEPS